jgi:hypothetical protein
MSCAMIFLQQQTDQEPRGEAPANAPSPPF